MVSQNQFPPSQRVGTGKTLDMRKVIIFSLIFIGFALAGQAQSALPDSVRAKMRPDLKTFLLATKNRCLRDTVGYYLPDVTKDSTGMPVRVFVSKKGTTSLKKVAPTPTGFKWVSVPKRDWVLYIKPTQSK
jgi:hypothetical protein